MLKNILTQSNIKKILTRWLVMVLGMAWTFADGQDPELLKKAAFMHNIIVFLSWIWVLLSMLAGKLMTNGLLYGGAFGLDVYLWTIWNAMKNIANFALWFIFLIVVIKEVFALNIPDSLADIAEKLKWFFIGGILIQTSWFMLLAMISLSTIVSTAVAALPSMVIQSDSARWWKIINAVNSKGALKGSTYTIKNSNTWSPRNLTLQYTTGNTVISDQETLDFLMPRYDNLWGSLYFMGLSVVGFQDYTSFNPTTSEDLKTMITWFVIKLIVTLWYAIILIMLILLNISRIVKIWIFIALMPLNIALWVLKHEKVSILGEDAMSVGGYVGKFNRGNLVQMVLQPTIITGVLWLSMIMLTAFWSVLGSTNNVDTNAINAAYNVNITNTTNSSQFTSESVDVHMIGNLLDGTISQAGWLFQSLILIALTFGLMALILYISAAVTKEEWLKKLTMSAAKLTASIPFLPITKKVGDLAGGLDKASGGKLWEAYRNFGSWLQLDKEGASGFAKWAGVPDPSKTRSLKYQAESAKSFTALQSATQKRYNEDNTFQDIYSSAAWKDNFVNLYNKEWLKIFGNDPLSKDNLEDIMKQGRNDTKKQKLRTLLFDNVERRENEKWKKETIKWFDDYVAEPTPPKDQAATTPPKK